MTAQIISGKDLALKAKQEVALQVAELAEKGLTVQLVVILVGENPASQVYVKGKAKDCEECGVLSQVLRMSAQTTQQELLDKIHSLNNDKAVNGILVQLPLPEHIAEKAIIEAIDPQKDVDGFTAVNVGKMLIGEDCFLPCTPAGCIEMLKSCGTEIAGKDAVVIGRSNIVGKPAAILLLQNSATVTICHSKTKDLKLKCLNADIIIAAIGKANFVTADMVKQGAIVVDVGINRLETGKLCGDVDFAEVSKKAAYITPVPGGVGLMTRAQLMRNTLKAAKIQYNIVK